MTVNASAGPLIVFGQPPPGSAANYNPSRGPSMFDMGSGAIDPRTGYLPGQSAGTGVKGWFGSVQTMTVDAVPSTASATAIAAAQVPASGTPMTLASTTTTAVTVGVSIFRPDTGGTTSGLIALDGAGGLVSFGTDGTVQIYDPTKGLSRCISITRVGNDSGATFLVSGFDIYGYPMTQRVTGANAGVVATLKAFKYVLSVTPTGTLSGSNVSIGTTDTFGLSLAVLFFPYVEIWAGAAQPSQITASTGFTPAVTTSPATALTGDVRGTYALQTASNGTNRLTIFLTPTPASISSATTLVGVTQA